MISETEKLAIEVEDIPFKGWSTDIGTRVAAELRRLAAVEQELEAALAANRYTTDLSNQALEELEALKRAISEAEPDAWLFLDKDPLGGNDDRWLAVTKSDFKDGVNPTDHFAVEPLYTLKGIK